MFDQIRFNDVGLIAAVVQHADSGEVLMLGWMNREALERTLQSGDVWFYSRSRQAMWRKGETSGNTLAARDVRLDCDRDALLVRALPAGPTCHTGVTSCFFRTDDGGDEESPASGALGELYRTLSERRGANADSSYTARLLASGAAGIGAKLSEEAGELSDAIVGESEARVVSEAADLLYHVWVALLSRGIEPADVYAELRRRSGTSGVVEKAGRETD